MVAREGRRRSSNRVYFSPKSEAAFDKQDSMCGCWEKPRLIERFMRIRRF